MIFGGLGLRSMMLASICTFGMVVAAGSAQANERRQEMASLPDAEIHKTADYVFVEKGKRRLTVWRDGGLLATFPVRLGRTPTGAKSREGDGRTPEGVYSIDYRKSDSSFYRAFHISYPSPMDSVMAQKQGVSPGGAIMIHGLPNDADKDAAKRIHKYVDWTEGCIAMTNSEIDELWQMVPPGTPIEIIP